MTDAERAVYGQVLQGIREDWLGVVYADAAKRIGMPVHTFTAKMKIDSNRYFTVPELIRHIAKSYGHGRGLLREMANLGGGFFVAYPDVETPADCTMRELAEVIREHSEAVQVVVDACRDGVITGDELQRALKEITEAQEALHRLALALTAMHEKGPQI
jgi:diaminopimelate decarboxylase